MTSITALLAQVSAEVGAVRKGDRNEHQRFNFRGIDSVVNAVHPVLVRHGITVAPTVREHHYSQIEVGKNRTLSGHCRLLVDYVFTAPDGSVLTARVAAEAMDSGDKAYPKAMSVAFRTALLQTLCLPTDEPDPDASTYERSPAAQPVDLDALTMRIAKADLDDLRAIWQSYHYTPAWSELGPLVDERRAQLDAS